MRAVLLFAIAAALAAQSPAVYQFGIDQDNLQGAPDFSFLNHPLTAADRVLVRDGHFYTAAGKRIRFFGANLAFGANFPAKDDSVRIARRLRRLGINLVRLHHMDSSPDSASNPGTANSVLTTGPYPSFNAVSIVRLRDFLNALAAEGIYADLNLHVGYAFRPATDNIPALPGQAIPDQSKPFQIFYPRMIDLQQQYTDGLIGRLQLRHDPVLAMVEINNESSLIQAWQWGQLDPVLGGEYRNSLQQQWNQWLAARYPSTDALAAAWGASTDDGPNLLNGKWTLEQSHGKSGVLAMTTIDGLPTAQVTPGQGSGWLFLKQTGFQVATGNRYVWVFQARTDGPNLSVPLSVMRDVSPWDGFYYGTITLTNQWQTFTIAVSPSFAIQDSGRVSLDVEYATGNVYARSMTLAQAGRRGLGSGESLEAGNIALLGPNEGANPARLADYTSFLIATDRAYVNAMRDTVRAATDPLVPITGTQMGYGGMAILDSQSELDYQDNHFYIDHYSFPNTAWDGFDWRIRDTAAADTGWSSFLDMAWARQSGRPYTVSEYNQPWPNTHGAEIDPVLAAFAGFQDWDGLMHFAYSHGRNWDDGVPNGFNINGDWTKFPVIGQSAWLFRTGAVAAGGDPLTVPVSAAERLQSASLGQSIASWVNGRVPKETAFTRAVALAPDATATPATPATANPELIFDAVAKRAILAAPLAAGVFGAAGAKVTAGPIDLELAPGSRNFVALLVTSLDREPIPASSHLLLSLPGYSLRSVPATNATPQRLVNYRGTTDWWTIDPANSPNRSKPSGDMNGGYPPTFLERIEAWVTLRTEAASVTVTPLDGAGNRLAAVEAVRVPGGFRIHLNGTSPWYEITATQHRRRPR